MRPRTLTGAPRPSRGTDLGGYLYAPIVIDGQVHGSGALFRWLLDSDLVDEMTLFICPVVVGQGTRLFPDTGRDRALELVESRATPSGITIQVYRPAGRPQYG